MEIFAVQWQQTTKEYVAKGVAIYNKRKITKKWEFLQIHMEISGFVAW